VVDAVPTLLELADVKPSTNSAPLAGRSMVPLVSGASNQVYASEMSISQELSGGAAVSRGDYKLVRRWARSTTTFLLCEDFRLYHPHFQDCLFRGPQP
jgi:arylsulfatase A-like enzyme